MKDFKLKDSLFNKNIKYNNRETLINHLKLILENDEEIKEYYIKDYFVTTKGRIFSIKNNSISELKYSLNNGYKQVVLFSNRKRFTRTIHKMVAECFLPNPKNFSQINHIDENRGNNELINLEWSTPKYNTTYSQGKKVKQICPKTKQVLNIFNSTHDAEKYVGACKGEVSNCCRHRRNQVKVKGYIFEYV